MALAGDIPLRSPHRPAKDRRGSAPPASGKRLPGRKLSVRPRKRGDADAKQKALQREEGSPTKCTLSRGLASPWKAQARTAYVHSTSRPARRRSGGWGPVAVGSFPARGDGRFNSQREKAESGSARAAPRGTRPPRAKRSPSVRATPPACAGYIGHQAALGLSENAGTGQARQT